MTHPSQKPTFINSESRPPRPITRRRTIISGDLFKMGNCLKPVMRLGQSHEENEETKALVISRVHDQVVRSSDECGKIRKKVRFKVQPDNAGAVAMETTMRSPRKTRGVRVKVVLTQSELKQILDRAAAYNHSTPPSFSVGQISGRIMVNCRGSRCSWNPILQTIHELSHY